jgi:predicted MFS family arabinose efflux permease
MNHGDTTATIPSTPATASWGAVFALTLCIGTLIVSEFMPVSLLTPIGAELHISEGRAGQAIAVSGLFAVLTSLSISKVTRGVDRRLVLLSLTLLMMVSGAMVAFAPNTAIFIVGRALVGVVIGGFWSMSAATVMRLVPESQVPRALGLLNGGNALAATIAAPLGSYLGQYIGWRGAFFAVVPLAALTLEWLVVSLPSMPAKAERSGTVFRVLRRRNIPLGMAAVSLFFMGQFVLQTYLRPYLETVTEVNTSTLSLILLVMGGAGVFGTYLIGLLLKTQLYSLLIILPLLMGAIGILLTLLGHSPLATTSLLAAWGLIGTAAPVGWWTWLSKVLPDDAEAGGGLMVAVIQLAIALGASSSGLLFDYEGYQATFAFSALILLISAVVAALCAFRARSVAAMRNHSLEECLPWPRSSSLRQGSHSRRFAVRCSVRCLRVSSCPGYPSRNRRTIQQVRNQPT